MGLRATTAFHGGLDVQLRAASTAIPTTPTQLILPTIVTMSGGIGYDNVTGTYTAPTTAVYDTVIQFNINVADPRTFFFYVEQSLDGGAFTINRYSARRINVGTASDGQITIPSTNLFPANSRFRFYFWVTGGAANMVTADVPGTVAGTVTVPAARVMITGA